MFNLQTIFSYGLNDKTGKGDQKDSDASIEICFLLLKINKKTSNKIKESGLRWKNAVKSFISLFKNKSKKRMWNLVQILLQ